MKKFLFVLITLPFLTFNTSWARQYIQCASDDLDSSERAVINLDGTNYNKSTLFITNGIHLPENESGNILVKLNLESSTDENLILSSSSNELQFSVEIPNIYINRSHSNFPVKISRDGINKNYHCFSAIYN